MPEISPHADEDPKGYILRAFELEVIQHLTERKADIGKVHRDIHGVPDIREVDEVAPTEQHEISVLITAQNLNMRVATYPTSQSVTKWCATSS